MTNNHFQSLSIRCGVIVYLPPLRRQEPRPSGYHYDSRTMAGRWQVLQVAKHHTPSRIHDAHQHVPRTRSCQQAGWYALGATWVGVPTHQARASPSLSLGLLCCEGASCGQQRAAVQSSHTSLTCLSPRSWKAAVTYTLGHARSHVCMHDAQVYRLFPPEPQRVGSAVISR